MQKLEVGSVVSLKLTGSPKMIINSILDENSAVCFWFNNLNELQTGTFNLVLLKENKGMNITESI